MELKAIIKWGLFIMVVTLSGCLLQQSETNFQNITPSNPSNVTLTINLKEFSDTTYIPYSLWLKYSIDQTNHPIDSSAVYLNDQLVHSTLGNYIYFYFDISQYAPGTYNLKVITKVKSSSGSLADHLGIEELVVVKKLVAVLGPPPKLKITQIDSTDGILVLHWEKYKSGNFKSYQLMKYDDFHSTLIKKITSADVTSWADSSYVGGDIDYGVSLEVDGTTQTGALTQVSWHPKMFFKTDNSKTVYYWEKPKFYRVTTGYNLNGVVDLPVTDTTYQEGPLNYLDTHFLAYVKFKSAKGSQFVAQTLVYKGKLLDRPSVLPYAYNSKDSIYYGSKKYPDENVVMDKNFVTLATVSPKGNISVSPNGKFVLMSQTTNYSDNLSLVNPKTLASVQSNIGTFITFADYPVADNGFFAFREVSSLGVYSLPKATNVFSGTPSNNSYTPFSLSGSGYYVAFGSALYNYNGYYFQFSNTLSINTNYILGFDKNENLIVYSSGGVISVINPLNSQILKTFNTNYTISNIRYDIFSDLLITNGQYVVDLNTGTQKQFSSQPYQLTLLNGKLFYTIPEGNGSQFVVMNAKPF